MKMLHALVASVSLLAACTQPTSPPPQTTQSEPSGVLWEVVSTTPEGEDGTGSVTYAAASFAEKVYALDYEGGFSAYNPARRSWTSLPSLPEFRIEAAIVAAEDRIFVLGGRLDDGTGVATAASYDPEAGTWARHADMPEAVAFPGVAVVDGAIYLIGGDATDGPARLVQRFDIDSGTWSLGSEMPTRRCALGLGTYDGKILAVAGIGAGSTHWWYIVDSVEEYDPDTDSWTTRPSLPVARDLLGVVTLRGRVYAVGGRTPSGSDVVASTKVFVYDPEEVVWREVDSLGHGRFAHATTTWNDGILVLGGRNDFGDREATVEFGRLR